MKFSIRDIDKGYNALLTGFETLADIRTRVGIQGKDALRRVALDDDAEENQASLQMVELATIHEFGAPKANIPQRSFLRSTADENRRKYERVMAFTIAKLLKNPRIVNVKGDMFMLGERVRRDIVTKINKHIPPPNALSTVLSKGDDTPLIDTGLMRSSISSKVGPK